MIGVIHQYNDDRGFGFIRTSFRTQFFFHISNWGGPEVPERGQKVEFDLGAPHKEGLNPQAVRVIPVDGGAR